MCSINSFLLLLFINYSSDEWEQHYDIDPDYNVEPSQSQACFKRGIYYTPPEWMRKYKRKPREPEELAKKKLKFDSKSVD